MSACSPYLASVVSFEALRIPQLCLFLPRKAVVFSWQALTSSERFLSCHWSGCTEADCCCVGRDWHSNDVRAHHVLKRYLRLANFKETIPCRDLILRETLQGLRNLTKAALISDFRIAILAIVRHTKTIESKYSLHIGNGRSQDQFCPSLEVNAVGLSRQVLANCQSTLSEAISSHQ